jgi:hypothetical protein
MGPARKPDGFTNHTNYESDRFLCGHDCIVLQNDAQKI